MISVASLENSKRLHEVSGWEDNTYYWYTRQTVFGEKPVLRIGMESGGREYIPAYDLSFLLDKLPPILPGGKTTLRLFTLPIVGGVASDKKVKWVIGYGHSKHENIADTPVDAACLLAVKLFENNVMKKGVN